MHGTSTKSKTMCHNILVSSISNIGMLLSIGHGLSRMKILPLDFRLAFNLLASLAAVWRRMLSILISPSRMYHAVHSLVLFLSGSIFPPGCAYFA